MGGMFGGGGGGAAGGGAAGGGGFMANVNWPLLMGGLGGLSGSINQRGPNPINPYQGAMMGFQSGFGMQQAQQSARMQMMQQQQALAKVARELEMRRSVLGVVGQPGGQYSMEPGGIAMGPPTGPATGMYANLGGTPAGDHRRDVLDLMRATGGQVGVSQLLAQPPQREILKDPAGRNRYADSGEVVFPQIGAAEIQGWTPQAMRQEFDYSKYDPESVKAAEGAGDPGLLKPRSQATTYSEQRQMMVDARDDTKKIREGVNAGNQIFRLLDQPGPITDTAAVISTIKALDPSSVVQPQEVRTMNAAMGIWEQLQSMLKKHGAGTGPLTDTARDNIRELTRQLMTLYKERYGKQREFHTGIAEKWGVDPDNILGAPVDFSYFDSMDPMPVERAATIRSDVESAELEEGLRKYGVQY